MDPLQSVVTDNNDSTENPIITTSNAGEIRIQLEGSHTTSTETEGPLSTNKKNVKFEDEKQTGKQNLKAEKYLAKQEDKNELRVTRGECQQKNETSQTKAQQTPLTGSTSEVDVAEVWKNQNVAILDKLQKQQQDAPNMAKKSGKISEQFEKIMDMFDSFTKDLEAMEFAVQKGEKGSHKRKIDNSDLAKAQERLEEAKNHRSHYEEYEETKEDQSKEDGGDWPPIETNLRKNHAEEYIIQEDKASTEEKQEAEEKKTPMGRSISTATSSCELKSLGCQTQLSDHISFNEISLLEVSSLTSRSEQQNSLNNYAQAENACISYYASQQEIAKQPLIETIVQQPITAPTAVQEASTAPTFSIITIEANSRPSSTDLRRPPFCERLWEVLGDFCAATFLCFQVNKDCIFCLGFFAAFVVSASFLTAFFYHTLIISQSLWQIEENT